MAEGFIKLHRGLIDKPIFQNEKLLKVWLWCLFKATHKPITSLIGKQRVELQPGQFLFGRFVAAEELDMHPSTVRDYMQILKDNKSIDIKPTNKYSLITIVNWVVYQSNNKDSDTKHDNKMTTKRQQNDTYKNVKNIKNDKKKDIKDIYAEFVTLTKVEHSKLVDQLGEPYTAEMIERLNLYKGSTGRTYSSDYMTILSWHRKDGGIKQQGTNGKKITRAAASILEYMGDEND